MAIQDSFIGNLRGVNAPSATKNKGVSGFIENFRNAVRSAEAKQNGYQNAPMQPVPSAKFHRLSGDQALVWQNSKYEPIEIATFPQTEKDWKNFESGIDDFKVVLDAYNNEPDQNARISLLEKSAPRFKDSERLSRYLYLMHEDEVANRDKTAMLDLDYRTVKPAIEKAIEDIMSHRLKRA